MDSIKKAYKRVIKNLSVFNKNINYISLKTNELVLVLFWDIIWCKIRYGITSNEYRIFEFYNLSESKRNTFISKRRYNYLNDKLVNKHLTSTINNKEKFNLKFKNYLKRDVNNINNMSFKQIEDFIIENKTIIGRSTIGSFITTYKEYNNSDYRSPAFLEEDMKNNKDYLIEKKITQHKQLSKISSLVFINVVSVYHNGANIVSSTLKFKDNKEIISGYIDINSGCIKGNFKDEKGRNYGKSFDGFEIPKFKSVIEIVKLLSEELSEIKQVEWTFIIGSKSIYLVDANIWDDYVFSQIPEFLNNNEGLMSIYKKF